MTSPYRQHYLVDLSAGFARVLGSGQLTGLMSTLKLCCETWALTAAWTGGVAFISLSSFWLSRLMWDWNFLVCSIAKPSPSHSLAVLRLRAAVRYLLWAYRVLSTQLLHPRWESRIKHLNSVCRASSRLLRDWFLKPLSCLHLSTSWEKSGIGKVKTTSPLRAATLTKP